AILQRKISGTSHPPVHGEETNLMQPCNRSHRDACSNLRHHRPPLLLPTRQPFLFITCRSQVSSQTISDQEVVALPHESCVPRPRGGDTWPLIAKWFGDEIAFAK